MELHDKKLYFIVNPYAGGAKTKTAERRLADIEAACKSCGRDFIINITRYAGHAAELAKAVPEDCITVAAGGDGTVSEVAEGLLASGKPPLMSVVPLGTGNDFVRSLGIKGSVTECVKRICCGTPTPVDYLKVGLSGGRTRISLNVLSIGYDVKVVQDHTYIYSKWGLGRLSYYISAFMCCFRYSSVSVRFRADGGEQHEQKLLLMIFGNGRFYGGGMLANPQGDTGDGLMNFIWVDEVKPTTILRFLPVFISGKYTKLGIVHQQLCKTAEAEIIGSGVINLDGELVDTDFVRVQLVPGGLEIVR